MRVQGKNEPGVASRLAEKLAAVGINLRGLSVAVIGAVFVCYIGLDSAKDAAEALNVLREA